LIVKVIFAKYLRKLRMLTRRLLRVKAFKVLFSNMAQESPSIDNMKKELRYSCEKTRELYWFLLSICKPLVNVARERIEAGKRKYKATPEEANPNYRFVNNSFVELLSRDEEMDKFCKKRGLVWSDYDYTVKRIFRSISASDYYKEYMASPESSFERDCNLFIDIFSNEFEDSEELAGLLEERSIYWLDDITFVLDEIIRNIGVMRSTRRNKSPVQKEEDIQYALQLLEESFLRYQEYSALIGENIVNWDVDRLVSTDKAIIIMGITEAVVFETIPVKVTINEYVEISKYFGTPNSRIFVNGILDSIILKKLNEGEIVKKGRGLQEGSEQKKYFI
jgi:N utilization substance protein B